MVRGTDVVPMAMQGLIGTALTNLAEDLRRCTDGVAATTKSTAIERFKNLKKAFLKRKERK